jgi:hypothetical protein
LLKRSAVQQALAGEEGYLGRHIYYIYILGPAPAVAEVHSMRAFMKPSETKWYAGYGDAKGLSTMRTDHVHSQMGRMAEAKTE